MKILDDLISGLSGDSVVREVHACALWTAVETRNSVIPSDPRMRTTAGGVLEAILMRGN